MFLEKTKQKPQLCFDKHMMRLANGDVGMATRAGNSACEKCKNAGSVPLLYMTLDLGGKTVNLSFCQPGWLRLTAGQCGLLV